MCRLLAYASPRPTSVIDAVGAQTLATFTAMAKLHNEGWGTSQLAGDSDVSLDAGSAAGTPLVALKAPVSALDDDDFSFALTTPRSRAGLVHLRLASSGMALALDNTHPFLSPDASIAFAHNGGASPAALMEPLIAQELRGSLVGTTDSERYFAIIRSHLAEGLDVGRAAAATVESLRPLYPAASLNALLLTPQELVVIHASSTARIPHHDFDESGLSEADLPAGHRTGYFQLWLRRSADGTVVVSSSGIPTDGWEPLAPETVTRIDLATMAVSTMAIEVDELESVA